MRLTKAMKEAVAEEAARKVFDEFIEKSRIAVGVECVERLLQKGQRLAKDIPEEWKSYIRTSSTVDAYESRNSGYKEKLRVDLPVSFAVESYIHDLYDIQQLKNYNKLKLEKEEYQEEVMQVLNSCTTDNQLKQTAQELFEMLPEKSISCLPVAVEKVESVCSKLRGIK